MIVVVEKNENGKIELTKEELEKILSDAHQEGYHNGYNDGSSSLKPQTIPGPSYEPWTPDKVEEPWWTKGPYCIKTETDPKNANISYTTTTSNGTVTKGIVHDDGKVRK